MGMKNGRCVYLLAMLVLTFFATGQAWAAATNGVWTLNTANGNWSTVGNWSGGSIADGPGATGTFTNTITASRTVTIDTTARTLGTLNLGAYGGVGGFTIAAGSGLRLTFNNSGANAQIYQSGTSNKTDTISSPMALADSLDIANATALKQLTLSGTITSVVTSARTISNIGAGTGGVLISGIIGNGLGSVRVVQNSTSSLLTLGGANTFTNGLVVKSGTASATVANGFGASANVITIGDGAGSQGANLNGGFAGTFAQPIVVAGGNSGTASITNTASSSFTGAVTLNNHDLKVTASLSSTTLKGGVTGTGNLILNAILVGGDVTLSTLAVNHTGTISNVGSGGEAILSSAIGTNVTRIVQNSPTSQMTLSGANTFTGGVFVKSGTLKGSGVANAFGASTSVVTLGDTTGTNHATVVLGASVVFTNPVAVASNNTGLATLLSTVASTLSGLVTLNSHDLTLSAPFARLTLTGGIAGTGSLTLASSGAGYIVLSGGAVNNAGSITNSGLGTGAVTISGGVGSNVTAITQAGTGSVLTVDTTVLTVNGGGTTLANNNMSGSAPLIVSFGVNGAGNLILKNNSSIPDGVTLSGGTRAISNAGQVVNSGTGTGNTLISTVIGPGVTRVVQSSATSRLVLLAANTYSGETAVDSGTLQASNSTGSATGTGTVNVNNGGILRNDGIISGAVNVNANATYLNNVMNVGAVNVYSGGTFQNNGTNTAGASVRGTLAGTGVISGDATNFAGGVLSPGVDGAPGGTLTMGNLTWNGGGAYKCEVASIANNDAGAGADYDRILVTNALTSVPGGEKLIIRMDSLGQTLPFQANRNYSLKVLTYGTAVNLDMADVTLDTSAFLAGGTWSVTNINKSIYVICLGATSPNKNYWIGTGNWSTATNWSLGHAPLTGEDVEFDFRDQASCTANVVSVNLGSLLLESGYTGTITCLTKYPGQGAFTNVSITGDCSIYGGVLTHLTNSGGMVESDRLSLSVGGNLTVGPAGAINVDQKGFDLAKGPSTGGNGSTNSGASHGGLGAMGSAQIAVTPTCGLMEYPTNLGSGATGRGGGAILLNVTGTATVNGVLSARGYGALYAGSAGGSILVQSASMEGTGVVDAAGGTGGTINSGGGGGGRIAVLLTNSATVGNVSLRAYGGGGGYYMAGAGTVYLQTAGQSSGTGTLIVDNGNLTGFNPVGACTLVNNFNLNQLAGVIIRNRGILGINTNTTIDFGVARIQGSGASVVTNWRTALAAPAGAAIALRGTNLVTFPTPFVISNYSLCLDVPVSVAGNWVVASNGSLSHSGNYNPIPGSEDYRLVLDLAGNLTVEAGGAIEANMKGYFSAKGPASPAVSSGQSIQGAGHGGRGGQGALVRMPSNSYGSVRSPRTLGSGGSTYTVSSALRPGGGSIELVVRGTTTVYGAISVQTSLPTESRCAGAAAGSVYLKTRYLQGSGSIDAQGDPSGADNSSPGGGGRIAVLLTASESFGDVTFSAAGCPPLTVNWASGAGTLYRERASEAGRGTLLIDNANRPLILTNSATQLPVPSYAAAGELTPVTLVVSNRANVELTGNLTMRNLFIYPNSILYLKGYTLTLNSAYHDDWGNASLVVYEGGQILWKPVSGSLIIIR
jgi:autotransporter-associated beta strand protein